MTKTDVRKILKHLQASWPGQELPPMTVEMWEADLTPLDFECAKNAIDALRQEREFMPLSAAIRSRWQTVHANAHAKLDEPLPTAKDFPPTPYMDAAKRLIEGEGRGLLSTPAERLGPGRLALKERVLETSRRHDVIMKAGGKPDAEMIRELELLADLIEGKQVTTVAPTETQAEAVFATATAIATALPANEIPAEIDALLIVDHVAASWPKKPRPDVERWKKFLAEFDNETRCILAVDRLRESGATEITPKQFRDAYAAVEL